MSDQLRPVMLELERRGWLGRPHHRLQKEDRSAIAFGDDGAFLMVQPSNFLDGFEVHLVMPAHREVRTVRTAKQAVALLERFQRQVTPRPTLH